MSTPVVTALRRGSTPSINGRARRPLSPGAVVAAPAPPGSNVRRRLAQKGSAKHHDMNHGRPWTLCTTGSAAGHCHSAHADPMLPASYWRPNMLARAGSRTRCVTQFRFFNLCLVALRAAMRIIWREPVVGLLDSYPLKLHRRTIDAAAKL